MNPTIGPSRFWAKVRAAESGCWEWVGATSDGYGHFQWQGRNVRAHRYLWERVRGPIPTGLVIDHLCRNRRCVNPNHLEVVTFRENILRGVGAGAQAARITHCAAGHALNDLGGRRGDRRWRRCLVCQREYTRVYKRAWRTERRRNGLVPT